MAHTHTILITGGTSGIGYQAALDIARRQPDALVILSSRTDKNSAATKINTTLSQENCIFLPLDLSSVARVRSYVESFAAKNYPGITILLLNAGLQFPDAIKYTDDGFEASFGVNHVGHALLFHQLYARGLLADTARIVITSSGVHDPEARVGMQPKYPSADELAHPPPDPPRRVYGRDRYASSKLANVLWTYALARRFEKVGNGMTVVAVDPGLVLGTGLLREAGPVIKFMANNVLTHSLGLVRKIYSPNVHTPEVSGANLAWIAVEAKTTKVYYEERREIPSSEVSYDEEKQEDLWRWTVKHIAVDEAEMVKFDFGG